MSGNPDTQGRPRGAWPHGTEWPSESPRDIFVCVISSVQYLKWCEVLRSARLCVCPLAYTSKTTRVQTSRIFPYVLSVAVARSSTVVHFRFCE